MNADKEYPRKGDSLRAATSRARRFVSEVGARRRSGRSATGTFGDLYPWLLDLGTTPLIDDVVHPQLQRALFEMGVDTHRDLGGMKHDELLAQPDVGRTLLFRLLQDLELADKRRTRRRSVAHPGAASSLNNAPPSGDPAPPPSGDHESERASSASSMDADSTSFGERHPWLLEHSTKPVDLSTVSTRAQKALERLKCKTCGDLAELRIRTFVAMPGVGASTVASIEQGLSGGPDFLLRHPAQPSRSYSERYPWISVVADEAIDLGRFDARSQSAFRRGNIRTWGELGKLTDESLAAIPNVGATTIQRVNDALLDHMPSQIAPASPDADPHDPPGGTHEPVLPGIPLAREWASLRPEIRSLGDLLDAYSRPGAWPTEVVAELDAFLAQPVSQQVHAEHIDLFDLVDELLESAGDRALLLERECSRERPTLETLGNDRGITRERVRQKVAKDAHIIRAKIGSPRFRLVRWAVDQLRHDIGVAAPETHPQVLKWAERLGDSHFHVLRWLAGYGYDDDWLVQDRDARKDLARAFDSAAGEQWLVRADEVLKQVEPSVLPDALDLLLAESPRWRDIGDGWLVRWDGPVQDKAERVLRLTCTPMTPSELVERIGHGSEGSIKNRRGERLVRIDKAFRLALPEWGHEEYEGIVTEIVQRIERGNGVASKTAIIDEFTRDFEVSVSSVEAYLGLPTFDVSGDAVRLSDEQPFRPKSASTIAGAVETEDGWGERQVVSENTMKGYSFGLSPHIAWANGLRPGDDLMVPIGGSVVHEASVIWRTTNLTGKVDVGRTREWLMEHGVGPGTEILLCPSPIGVAIFLGAEEIDEARRAKEASAPAIASDIASLMEGL